MKKLDKNYHQNTFTNTTKITPQPKHFTNTFQHHQNTFTATPKNHTPTKTVSLTYLGSTNTIINANGKMS